MLNLQGHYGSQSDSIIGETYAGNERLFDERGDDGALSYTLCTKSTPNREK